MTQRDGRLSKREALVLREMAATPRRAVPVEVLLDAGRLWGGTERQERKRLSAMIHWIRSMYGPECIQSVRAPNEGRRGWHVVGYALYPEHVQPIGELS